MGIAAIEAAEADAVARTLRFFKATPGLHMLGSSSADRLAIFSFNIASGGQLLHHGLVVTLLNDIFGIQARGGCSCAGPYGHDLLGIDANVSAQYRTLVMDGLEVMKPGWVRVGFPPVMDNASIDYVLDALAFIADRGHDLIELYDVNPESGCWTLKTALPEPSMTLDQLCWWRSMSAPSPQPLQAPSSVEIFAEAATLADKARTKRHKPCAKLPDNADQLRWFQL
ncbi:hypothetical protein PSQ19_12340 [Devosia algicola]|uniref:Aminotransferase class V-fold PLP-dependent enzyme n=1 Tax=Devosia algicola TaxID=3026418 RepID=A0ABY7YJV2_9HYPH|nr:hypothetical protein [Devosia algicola]WDR01566.1 hypothetical protein PSQ19_12340 [Devosia algicola]